MRDMFDGHPEWETGAVVCRVAPSFIRFGTFELPVRTPTCFALADTLIPRWTAARAFDTDDYVAWFAKSLGGLRT